MDKRGITRGPRKASESSRTWTSLGAEVDGTLGWVGSASKLEACWLQIVTRDTILEDGVRLSSREHALYAISEACLFDNIYEEYNNEKQTWVSESAIDELLTLTCTLPTHWIDQRCEISGTDASEDGRRHPDSTSLRSRNALRGFREA